jgi:TetR/AcrR family transcriptional repressor of mexJK operon
LRCASFFQQAWLCGTSMSGLVEVGGSENAVSNYFKSKEELFTAVAEQVSDGLYADLPAMLTSREELETVLERFCCRFLHTISSPDAVATWRTAVAEGGQLPELGQIFFKHTTGPTETALSLYLGRNIVAGKLRSDRPVAMAQTLMNLCAGWHSRLLLGVAAAETVSIDTHAIRIVELFLRSYAVQSNEA